MRSHTGILDASVTAYHPPITKQILLSIKGIRSDSIPTTSDEVQ